MLLDEGHIVEFDSPAVLLSDPNSRFYSLCKAAGKTEFSVLKRLAGVLDPWPPLASIIPNSVLQRQIHIYWPLSWFSTSTCYRSVFGRDTNLAKPIAHWDLLQAGAWEMKLPNHDSAQKRSITKSQWSYPLFSTFWIVAQNHLVIIKTQPNAKNKYHIPPRMCNHHNNTIFSRWVTSVYQKMYSMLRTGSSWVRSYSMDDCYPILPAKSWTL